MQRRPPLFIRSPCRQHNGSVQINQHSACGACWLGRTVRDRGLSGIGECQPWPSVALGWVLVLPLLAAPTPGHAKDTGLIFVSNEKSNNLIVLDPKTYQVVKDIKTSRRPRDMHFNADHDKLYVACGDDDVIDIIDVAKLEVIGKLDDRPEPGDFRASTRAGGASTWPTRRLLALRHRHRPEHHRSRGADRRRA